MSLHIAHQGRKSHPHVYRCYKGLVVRLGATELIVQVR